MNEQVKAFIFAILLFCFCIIAFAPKVEPNGERDRYEESSGRWEHDVFEIDGCEYVFFPHGIQGLTHKGNCKNEVHNGD
jgi:hypothetical protein